LVILGDPIAQMRPSISFNPRLLAPGCNQRRLAWQAPVDAFEQVMHSLTATRNLNGIAITYPFKERGLAFANTLSSEVATVGAANALWREGTGRSDADMFDGVGLVRAAAGAVCTNCDLA